MEGRVQCKSKESGADEGLVKALSVRVGMVGRKSSEGSGKVVRD